MILGFIWAFGGLSLLCAGLNTLCWTFFDSDNFTVYNGISHGPVGFFQDPAKGLLGYLH
jgi:hypothetical protein